MKYLSALTLVLAATLASPAAAQQVPGSKQIMPGGGTTVQEGVETAPTNCPDGSRPATTGTPSTAPTDTSIAAGPNGQTSNSDTAQLCPNSGETTTGDGVDPTDQPNGIDHPSMK